MTLIEEKLILLDYKEYELIPEFKGFRLNDKLIASQVYINAFVLTYGLMQKIHNPNSVLFYMNLLNFGNNSSWKLMNSELLFKLMKYTINKSQPINSTFTKDCTIYRQL